MGKTKQKKLKGNTLRFMRIFSPSCMKRNVFLKWRYVHCVMVNFILIGFMFGNTFTGCCCWSCSLHAKFYHGKFMNWMRMSKKKMREVEMGERCAEKKGTILSSNKSEIIQCVESILLPPLIFCWQAKWKYYAEGILMSI